MKPSWALTGYRSPSCLPYILPPIYEVHMSSLPDSILNIHCLTYFALQSWWTPPPPLPLVTAVVHTSIFVPSPGPLHSWSSWWTPVLPDVFMVSFAYFTYTSAHQGVISWHLTYGCLRHQSHCFIIPVLVAHLVKNLTAMQETGVWSLGWEDPLETGKATHSSILPWRIPWTV